MLSFKMALRSISSNKMRAVLTMLGIIIGVMALVVLVSLVNGATSSVTDAVSGLGSDMLTISISDDKGAPVTLSTLDEWKALRKPIYSVPLLPSPMTDIFFFIITASQFKFN